MSPTRPKTHKPLGAPLQPRDRRVRDKAAYAVRQKFLQSAHWRRVSKHHLSNHPCCIYCERRGRVTAGTLTDHWLSIQDGGASLDPLNFRSCCDRCHTIKTNAEIAARRAGTPGQLTIRGCDEDGLPFDPEAWR